MTILTSGSTGEPMAARQTQRFHRINTQEHIRQLRAWGFERHSRVAAIANPTSDHPPGAIKEIPQKHGRARSLHTTDTREAFEFVKEIGATSPPAGPITLPIVI